MKCKVCGAPIPNDVVICPYCDSEIERKVRTGRPGEPQRSSREQENVDEAVERLKQSLKARSEALAAAEVKPEAKPDGKKKKSPAGAAVFALLALGILAAAGYRHISAKGSESSTYQQRQEAGGSSGHGDGSGTGTAKSAAQDNFSGYWETYYSGAGSHTGINIGLYGDTYDLTAWSYFDRSSAKETMTASLVDGQLVQQKLNN